MDLNEVRLKGRLIREPEFRFIGEGGMPKWSATVVVSGLRWDSKEKREIGTPTFVAIETIGQTAEHLADELRLAQGDYVYVIGELRQRSWNTENGEKREKTHVEVDFIEVIRRKVSRPRSNGEQADTGEASDAPPEDPGI